MGWTHRFKKLEKVVGGKYRYYVNYFGQADASDLSDYVLVDASALLPFVPTKTEILWLHMSVGGSGMMAVLEWDATTDDLIMGCPDGCSKEWPPPGGVFPPDTARDEGFTKDPASSGTTGDIVLTTIGGAVGDSVSIQLVLELS
uniref:Uncharacterized protein n=1 Tax=viral metagenome TaxID=1070528 RepID=A0A6M3L2N6_9ZZZZ